MSKSYVGKHELFDVYGAGHFNFNLTNFSVSAVTGPIVDKSKLCISFEVNVFVGGYHGYFDNLMNNDPDLCPLINDTFNDIMRETLTIIFKEYVAEAEEFIQKLIDFIMGLGSLGTQQSSLSGYILSIATDFLNPNTSP
ncbi:uncharacterized protein LOC126735636 [Anthonomus grandis grandis]|uniref:uncharacterized protein LOC126735636 n=1 Tax=Anthonomus grandis grandis TaxID=2921223 RepID=UPI002165DEC3|nr:uncharacterized protein LOC126735636 [Anthonomus grandis grandis]